MSAIRAGVGLHGGAGQQFGADVAGQSRRGHDTPGDLQPVQQHADVVGVAQVVGLDPGRGRRVWSLQADAAAALREQVADMQGQPIPPGRLAPVVVQIGGQEMKLKVGPVTTEIGPHKAPRLGHVRGQLSGPVAAIGPGGADRAWHKTGRDADRQAVRCRRHDGDVQMIRQIRADLRRVMQHGDAVPRQFCRRADARQQQKLGRVHRAARQDHFSAGVQWQVAAAQAHRHGTAAVEQDAFNRGAGLDREIRPVARGGKKGAGGAVATAIALGDLKQADAVLSVAVEIGVGRESAFGAGLDKGAAHRVGVRQGTNRQRPGRTVMRPRQGCVAFQPQEQRAGAFPTPVRPGGPFPAGVIGRVAAHVDHRVDRT